MIRQIGRFTLAAALMVAATAGLAAESWADCEMLPGALYNFDFGSGYSECFREVQRVDGITPGMDLGLATHTSLNFTGSAAAGGATWLTIVDQAPGNSDADNKYGSEFLCADILIQRFDNTKGAGVVAFLNEGVGQKGLALILYNAGNTDRLVLATVEGHPAQAGKLATVKSLSLGSLIQENAWYRVMLTAVVDGPPQIMGQVFKHAVATDPNSAISPVGGTLVYTPESLPDGVETLGQNALIASAFGAVVNASVTNFSNILADCRGSSGTAN
jgi:hypothetical protein